MKLTSEPVQARKEVIEARLLEIRRGDVAALVRESWEAHHGVMCIGINWERHSTLPKKSSILLHISRFSIASMARSPYC